MSLHQVNSAFNLLGQVQEPADPVRLPGPAMPTLGASCGTFHQSLPSNLVAIFSGPRSAKNFIYQGFFKDGWIEGNPAFNNTELTWSGPVNDLPLPDLSNAPTEPARRAKAAIVRNEAQVPDAAAFHPRQRIFTDAVHPTHPRQTLINPKAPLEPPKILPSLPNIVQLQRSVQPAKPRMEIDEKTLAQLRPREHQAATAPIAPPPEVPVFLQQQADLTIQAESTAPVRPKLALNSGAAPRVAARAQSGDPAAAPELSEARADANGNSESTLIALSAAPAPPAANIAAPQGNLAARVSISPEGKPGASGASTGDAAADNRAGAAAGNAHSEVTVSISGGNPVAKNTMSGLGGAPGSSTGIAPGKSAGRLAMVSPHDMLARRPTRAEADEIYTLYVNMPNLSSATGSWILNFSEMRTGGSHQAMTTLAAPVLFKKVDPKYPPTLAADRVEGEIVLYAVIRKDGSVDSVQLVRGLDGVLDANSMTALSQWKFRPATREEQPVELETVVHIPFHATVPQ